MNIPINIDIHAKVTGFDSARTATPAHHRIMKHYASPVMLGPAPSDDLLEMMMLMFTEDEADLAQHLPPLRPRTAQKVAKLSGRSLADVTRVLDRLALTKFVILAIGDPRKYTILPIVPGTFEMALMTNDLSTRNAWHKRFAELFERLWDKGYLMRYVSAKGPPVIHVLPAAGISKSLYAAWPSERLEEVLAPYSDFAVGNCQCRLAMRLVGKGCDRPLENCVVFGPTANVFIERGLMRRSDRQEILAIKREAEEEGCVTWLLNEVGEKRLGNGSCSCCGCCCHALRSITQFNTPGTISQPHFLPQLDAEQCVGCQRCVKACPMGAWTMTEQGLHFDAVRCIGCGLCVVACRVNALTLQTVQDARPPQESWFSFLLKLAPAYLTMTVREWSRRLRSQG